MPLYITAAPSTATTCAVPGCRPHGADADSEAGPRPTVPGTDMCKVHHDAFRKVINNLAISASALEQAGYRKSSSAPDGPRVSTSGIADVSSAWNPLATEALANLTDWTRYLVRTILKEAPVPADDVRSWDRVRSVRDDDGVLTGEVEKYKQTQIIAHEHTVTETTPAPLALAVIGTHYARWLSGYPEVGPAFLEEAQEHSRAAQRALGTASVRSVVLHRAICGETVILDDDLVAECGAPMRGIFPDDETMRVSRILCSVHPESHKEYSSKEWSTWGAADPTLFILVDTAAAMLGVSPSTAARFAREEGWKVKPGTRPREYSYNSVRQTWLHRNPTTGASS